MPEESRAWWRARHMREQLTHSCGHPREVCSDPEREWYPQMTVCYPTMVTEAMQAKYARLHEKRPWHNGSFTDWAEEPSVEHPYHYTHGTTIWVSEQDLAVGGEFLSPSDGSS